MDQHDIQASLCMPWSEMVPIQRMDQHNMQASLCMQWRDALRMSGVTEEQLQQLNMDYPLSEHSRTLYRVGPSFEDPIDYYDALIRSRL
ncbi:hypothetical protein HAX54_032001 [Datura stramonium]|uniref:Uncharacterized protein n=1 Tax=Datura stramonium TaxID=4076 RepID=A0ABS8VBC7_DATST|nr:hypothetical protein [Datura stramonium]